MVSITSISRLEPVPYGRHDRHAHQPDQVDVLALIVDDGRVDVMAEHTSHESPAPHDVGVIA